MDVTWEPDAFFRNAERGFIRTDGKVFRTAALDTAALVSTRRMCELHLAAQVVSFLAGKRHHFIRHDPAGEPNVWTRPGTV